MTPNEKNKLDRHEELLQNVRQADGPEAQRHACQELVNWILPSNRSGPSRNVREVMARQVLLEWPYGQLSQWVDAVMDACGVQVTVYVCTGLLKDLMAASSSTDVIRKALVTRLPHPSILHACWVTLQRQLLPGFRNQEHGSLSIPIFSTPDTQLAETARSERMASLVQMILLLPQILSNAYHVMSLPQPILVVPTKFYPRLVEHGGIQVQRVVTTPSQEESFPNEYPVYLETLVKALLKNRQSNAIALGLSGHHPHTQLAETFWSARERATLIMTLLQHHVATATPTIDSDDYSVKTTAVVGTCRALLTPCSWEHQQAFVQLAVFSRGSRGVSTIESRLGPLIIQLLKACGIYQDDGEDDEEEEESDSPDSIPTKSALYLHMLEVAETWSQWTFCHQTDQLQQHYVTQILLCGLDALQPPKDNLESDELAVSLLQGVTHRLEFTLPQIRQDGMMVAQQVAKRLGQDLHFDELDNTNASTEFASKTDLRETDEVNQKEGLQKDAATKKKLGRRAKASRRNEAAVKELDPDADYVSSSDEDDNDADDDRSDDSSDSCSDNSTSFDEVLLPYNLDDDEADLVETPKPLHLLECLELLRTPENQDSAYSNHETALQSLPSLIEASPDDLQDIAVSLLMQLIRMENKFNIEQFSELNYKCILALVVQEPLLIGQKMIEEVFEESGLSDRLRILAGLQEAAYYLSGSKEQDQRKTDKEKRSRSSPNKLRIETQHFFESNIRENDQLSRIQSKTRRKRSRPAPPAAINNRFSSVAPMWFYALVAGFVQRKANRVLWSGSTGSHFLAALFRTLAIIVEFSGVYGSPILAKDLMDLVWSFRDADVAEIRLSVLVSVATSIATLPEGRMVEFLMAEGASLPQLMSVISSSDPDTKCRSLAVAINQSIGESLRLTNGQVS